MRLIDGKLNKGHVRDLGSDAQSRDDVLLRLFTANKQKRAYPVDRDLLGRLRAKLVIEDFERQRSIVPCSIYRLHEIPDGQVSLPRETAKMPAPRENIQVELRGVCELNQKYSVCRYRLDWADRKTWCQRMEGI
jgi:hypothetical protein